MRAPFLFLLPLLAALPLPAQAPADAKADTKAELAVRCGTLHLGDGSVLRDVWLTTRDGRIRSIGTEPPPAGVRVIDASSKVVMPGIVAADSDLSEVRDEDYAITPDFVAVDGFDFVRNRKDALQGGVTTAYLSPGRNRLVSGQGSVVKLSGGGATDVVEQVLRENACLRVNLGDSATTAPRVFEPTAFPTSDDPLLPSRIQRPSGRISLLAELRQLLRAPGADAAPNGGLTGPGSAENQYDPAALHAVARGELALRAATPKGRDVRAALQLADEIGAGRRLVLEDPWEIGTLAARAAALGTAATFRMPVTANAPTAGGEDRRQEQPLPDLTAPARAAGAGMKIALAPPPGAALRDYLWSVAHAVRFGLPPAAALRAVTGDAAAILGVDDRVGLLAPDRDADFLILTGEPFAVGTLVEATYVGGELVFQRQEQSRLLAVRIGRAFTGDGRSFGPATILCEEGRIVAVGEGLSVPYGARVIDLPDGTATPGLIDAFSHLGLAGDGTGVPPGAANQKLTAAIAHDDPMFAPAREAGITSVLVSGKDGGPVAGRVAAIKTGARDRAGMVLREVAGQRFVHDAIGPDATRGLKETIDRGRRYVEAWQKYEQALADFKAGKGKKPVEAPPPPPPANAGPDPISGTWEAEINVQEQITLKVVMNLKLEGSKVTGSVQITFGPNQLPAGEIADGSFENGKLKVTFRMGRNEVNLEADVSGDTMTGKLPLGPGGARDFTATRTSKTPGAAPAARPATGGAGTTGSGEPQKPNVDENLEPIRAVIGKRAAAVIRVTRPAAVADVIALFEQEQLPYVLHGADGVLDDRSVLAGKQPGVILGPELVRDESDGSVTNLAARMAALGLSVAFGTGECRGARNLPLHAAYAVRYGLPPEDALAAMTSVPAKLFRLDDRIGTLQKGKDADFVVFSGAPFEPTSRVLLVVVNGDVVVDRRTEAR